MKKSVAIIVVIVVLLGVTAVALPFWSGVKTQKVYERLVQQFGDHAGVQPVNTKYDRGWLHATAETVVRTPGLPLQLNLTHEITHGPLAIGKLFDDEFDFTPMQAHIDSRVQVMIGDRADASDALSTFKLPPITAHTTIALNGDGTVRAELPATKQAGTDAVTAEWATASAVVSFNRSWKKLQAHVRAPRITIAGHGAAPRSVTLANIQFHSDIKEGIAGYYFGDNTLTIARIAADPGFVIKGLRLAGAARPAGDNVELTLTYQVEAVNIADKRFGPGHLTVKARRLDAEMLKKFDDELNRIYAQKLPEEQTTLLVLGRFLELVTGLAKKTPEVEITRLRFKFDRHEISGRGKLVLDGSNVDLSDNPMLLLTALRGEAELIVPPALLKLVLGPLIQRDLMESVQSGALSPDELAQLDSETISRIVDQALPLYLSRNKFTRLLVPDTGQYKITAAFRRGQLLINNQPWRGASVHLP